MNNDEKGAREIFGEINEKDDYLIRMMGKPIHKMEAF
jgi:hypothetical protein